MEVTADQATTVEFYNQLLRGKITGHKTGSEQAPLEGVTFGLFDTEVIEFSAENAIATAETNANGEFSFEAPYGSFQVMELATLPGYLTMEEPVAVVVNTAEVELEPIANNQTIVHISKVDAETGEELPGAQYHYQVIAALETNTRSPVYPYTDLSDSTEMEDFRAALLEETGVGAIPQAEGYLTLSTCNNQGGDSRVLVIAALVEEVQR